MVTRTGRKSSLPQMASNERLTSLVLPRTTRGPGIEVTRLQLGRFESFQGTYAGQANILRTVAAGHLRFNRQRSDSPGFGTGISGTRFPASV